MIRNVAGVFGRDARAAGSAVRSALGEAVSGELATATLALAWTGDGPTPGSRTVLLAGHLRNARALSAELDVESDASEERLLSVALERWGEPALGKLRGGFVVVLWDSDADAGLVAVDQLGVGSVYFHVENGRLALATEPSYLWRLLPRRPPPAPDAVVQWIADGYLRRGETLLQGIGRLEGGHLLRLAKDRWESIRYWAPAYVPPLRLPPAEAAEQLGTELTRAVEERLPAQGLAAVQVSGGLDSSAVAAFAHKLERSEIALRAYSLIFPDHAEMDESVFIDRLEHALDLRLTRMPVHVTSSLRPSLEFQLTWGVPPGTPMLAFNVPLLRRAAQDGVQLLLDGEGGDELFGCSPYLVADRIRRGDVGGAIKLLRRLPWAGTAPRAGLLWGLARQFGLKGAIPHGVHGGARRLLGAARYSPRWLKPSASKRYVELRDDWAWKKLDGPRWWSYHADLLTSWRERMGAHDLLRQRAALAGLENAHPLLDDLGLVELILRLPPDLAFHPTLTRPLVRRALTGLVPDEIRLRTDKVDFNRLLIESLSTGDEEVARELLLDRGAEISAYVEQEAVARLCEVPHERRTIEWAQLLSRLATTESWLRSQSDPELPARLIEQLAPSVNADRHGRPPRRARTS